MSAIVPAPNCPVCGPFILRDKAPETVNGTPEPIISSTAADVSAVTGSWVIKIAESITATTPAGIMREVSASLDDAALEHFAKPASEGYMHGVMLGALDSAYEADTNNSIEAPEYQEPESLQASSRQLAGAKSVTYRVLGFSSLEYEEATDIFLSKKVLTRPVFDALSEKAKQKAFTVARAAKSSMILTVQRELARQVAIGADLKDFRQVMAKRLERAGWTPASKSHVETIFRTGVQATYNAGGAEHRMRPTVLKTRPFWQIVTVNDGPPRQRATHRAVHLWVLRADNVIWATCHPPFGFNCRCRVRSLPATYDGEVKTELPDLPDDGFSSGIGALM